MKISGISVVIIGLAVALIALMYAYFHVYDPNMTVVGYQKARKEAYDAEAAKLPQAQKRVRDAEEMVAETVEKWNAIAASKTPPASGPGGINLNQNAWDLTVSTFRYRNVLQEAVNRQAKVGGVTVENGPFIPEPDSDAATIVANYFNYPAIGFPVVIFTSTGVQVRGTYDQIMANVRAWRNMPNYLAVADGLTLQGTSPSLLGTYNVTIVGYVRGRTIFPPVPSGSASQANLPGGMGAPGGFGGPPPFAGGGPPGGSAFMPPGGPAGGAPPMMPPGGPGGGGGARPTGR